MKYRIALSVFVAATLMTTGLLAADTQEKAGTYGETRAKMVNNYVTKVLQPLFTCFAANYNSGRNMKDPDQAERIEKKIKMCRSVSTTSFAPPPDSTASQLRSGMLSLISKLEQKLSGLASSLRKQKRAKQDKVKTGQLYGLNGTKVYTSEQRGTSQTSNYDPRNRYDNDVRGTRNALINLGTEYEALQKRLAQWTKRIQSQINMGAKQRQQRQ